MKKVSTQHISEVRKRNGLIDIAIGDFDRLIFKAPFIRLKRNYNLVAAFD